jgi:hypothetical protein
MLKSERPTPVASCGLGEERTELVKLTADQKTLLAHVYPATLVPKAAGRYCPTGRDIAPRREVRHP